VKIKIAYILIFSGSQLS